MYNGRGRLRSPYSRTPCASAWTVTVVSGGRVAPLGRDGGMSLPFEFRVRRAGAAQYTRVFLTPSMSEGVVERAVSLAVGLAPATFGIRNAEGVSGLHAGLSGDWDAVPLPGQPGAPGAATVAAAATAESAAAASASAAPSSSASPSFESDAALLEDALRSTLSPAQREAFRAREFDYARVALRERRFDTGRTSMSLLLAQLNGRVKTTTQRRLSSAAGGLYLDGLLAGGDVRGRAADIFCAVRVADGAVGASKVFYAAAPSSADSPAATADGEWRVSQLLDAAAAAGAGLDRARVVRYSDRLDLGHGRAALFMPMYARSLHQLVHESRVAAPLPAALLLRAARDVLRGLVLMHAAGVAHCDVKPDNVMFDGAGAATLIDLGAATPLGEPTREGAPEGMALGLSVALGSASVDLACLASTLWWASQRAEPPGGAGSSPARLADIAERAADSSAAAAAAAGGELEGGAPEVLRAIAAILRADSAAAALAALAGTREA
jgi:hypothetical protein